MRIKSVSFSVVTPGLPCQPLDRTAGDYDMKPTAGSIMKRSLLICLLFALINRIPVQAVESSPPRTYTNSLGMKFVWIAPGTFMMGSPKEEKERSTDELQHKVTLTKGFYMGIYAVTQEQWTEMMGKNPSKFTDGKNLPVEQVNWMECQEFIKKLQEKDKKPYRLPTEAEWEYACRAGKTTPFYTGETIATDQANYNGNYAYGGGKKACIAKRPCRWEVFPLIRGDCMTCTGMSGNGARTCSRNTPKSRRL